MQIDDTGACNSKGVALLQEDHGAQVVALPFGRQSKCRYQPAAVPSLRLYSSDDAETSDYGGVPQGPAAIFSTRDKCRQAILGNGEINIGVAPFGRFEISHLNGEIQQIRIARIGADSQIYGCCRALSRCTDLMIGAVHVAADEFGLPAHYHLRGIDVAGVKGNGVIVLPRAKLWRRERIGPAQLIPVIHVLFDGDYLCAGNRLRLLKAGEHAVRGGTARTTFASE